MRGRTVAIVTRGDANTATEHWSIDQRGTLGKELFVIPALGRVLRDAESPMALTLALTLACVSFIIFAFRRIWSDPTPPSDDQTPPPDNQRIEHVRVKRSHRWSRISGTALLVVCILPLSRTSTAAAWAAGSTNNANTFAVSSAFATISSVALQNRSGGIAGKIEKGDQITVTYSETMQVSSFCPAWSGDSTNQSLAANGDVTVTVHDGTGATDDSITVASTTCTFNFGTIDLGSNSYVSGGNATLSGSGSNKSTITWTAAAHTLTITLGASGGGTLNIVASCTPTYTASASITSTAGGILTNSPYVLATNQYF